MPYDPERHHRRSIRLKGYDYTQSGAYFVTICVQHGECRFGEIVTGEMLLNDAGLGIQTAWEELPERFPTVQLDISVVMPNHFHAILVISDTPAANPHVGAPLVGAPLVAALPDTPAAAPGNTGGGPQGAAMHRPALGDMVGAFKSLTTDAYIAGVHQGKWLPFDRRLWQRGYYEHIIRHERALERIREYIRTNPQRWELDRENPQRQGVDDFDRWLDLYAQGGDP